MSALKIGQKVPWVLVGTGKADASGRYSISLPVAKLAPEESYGVVNLQADAPSAIAFFPVAVTRNSGDAYLPSTHVANLDATPGSPELPACGYDGWNYIRYLGKHVGTVGETYVLTSHATQQFSYSAGQSSSIEMGESGSGAVGSFHDIGTRSASSGMTEGWPRYGANKSVWYQTNFKFGEYTCRILGYTFYLDAVNGWAGGTINKKPTSIPSTPSKYCNPQLPGTTAKIYKSHAVTWSGGLGIGAALGFQASVQTGYDTSAMLIYHFTAHRHLCGWKDDPGATPVQVVVHT
jgi:hypothetical protein